MNSPNYEPSHEYIYGVYQSVLAKLSKLGKSLDTVVNSACSVSAEMLDHF